MWTVVALALGTFVSEDAALAGAAVLAHADVISPAAAAAAVAVGIWTGDAALFTVGRLASRSPILARRIERRWTPSELQALSARLERRAAWAILISRAVPGTRLPLYVAAGLFRLRASLFLACTAVAATIWTVVIVVGVSWLP